MGLLLSSTGGCIPSRCDTVEGLFLLPLGKEGSVTAVKQSSLLRIKGRLSSIEAYGRGDVRYSKPRLGKGSGSRRTKRILRIRLREQCYV